MIRFGKSNQSNIFYNSSDVTFGFANFCVTFENIDPLNYTHTRVKFTFTIHLKKPSKRLLHLTMDTNLFTIAKMVAPSNRSKALKLRVVRKYLTHDVEDQSTPKSLEALFHDNEVRIFSFERAFFF